MIRLLAMFAIAVPRPVAAMPCGTDESCNAGEIDRFFLPLIAASLAEDAGLAVQDQTSVAAPLNTSPTTSSPRPPVLIRPKDRPTPTVLVPVLTVHYLLTGGHLVAGGNVQLYVTHESLSSKQVAATAGTAMPATMASPTFRQTAPHATLWEMQHSDVLPAVPQWPLGGLTLPIDMRLVCGACGPDGTLHHFSGTAELELQVEDIMTGGIDNIDLVANDGMTAKGHLSFTHEDSSTLVIKDALAEMILTIGDYDTRFQGEFYAWMTSMMRLNGALAMVPTDWRSGIGAVAGHFGGTPGVKDCGVEN